MTTPASLLIPDLICKTVTDIPFETFFEQGVQVVVFDIDNTLVSYETPLPTQQIRTLLESLVKRGIRVALVSNNSPERVETFNRELGYFAVPDSHKPLKRALKPVFTHFKVTPKQVLLVGDQLLTDVLAARLWGAFAVTVSPIQPVENRFFRFKRQLEKPFVALYHKRKQKENAK